MDLNHRPSGYEPDKLPLLYPATRARVLRTCLYYTILPAVCQVRKETFPKEIFHLSGLIAGLSFDTPPEQRRTAIQTPGKNNSDH